MHEVKHGSPEAADGASSSGALLPCRRRLHGVIDTVKLTVAAPRRAKSKAKTRKQGSLIQGDDMSGAIAKVTPNLAWAKINVTVVDAVSAGGGPSVSFSGPSSGT